MCEALLSFKLKRVVSGVAGILVQAINRRAVLWKGEERLRYRRRAGLHLFDPAGVGNRHPIKRSLARIRRELIEELRPHGEKLGVQSVEGNFLGSQASTLVPHVSRADIEVFGKLVLDGKVPLLRVREAVRIEGAIVPSAIVCSIQPLAVEGYCTDERGRGEILRKSLAKNKRGLQPPQRA